MRHPGIRRRGSITLGSTTVRVGFRFALVKSAVRRLFVLAMAIGLAVSAWMIRRASLDRVTLDVREADLGSVVRDLRQQTWENIILRPGATGVVTLRVHNVPLEEVLGMLAEQARCRLTPVQAVHRD